ncbi:MAG: LamG domain-containing protein [Candidatus Poribacteria bacterium]|nr:LamG domain-containing protein [Candidatus Poribacteria bacterium]
MRFLFVILILTAFVTSFAFAAEESDDSLILYFSFDELDGDMTIDHSQYENDGSIKGAPQLVDGKFGKALKFNGTDDWIEVPHDPILTVETSVTVMAWINAERHMGPNNQRWQGIVAKGNSPRSYSFYTESPSECLHLSAGGGSVCTGKIALNEWQHVVGQVDDGTHRYWLNGEMVGEFGGKNALPGAADTSVVYVGTTGEGANRRYLGLIDEVRIWNRALSEEEVMMEMKIGHMPGTAVDPREKLATTWSAIKSHR